MASIEVEMKEIYKLICSSFERDQDIILKVRGNSMFPLMRDRIDSFKLTRVFSTPKKRDIVLYIRANGDFVLHRIIKVKKGYFLITGDNQWLLEKVNFDQVKGVVSEIHRGKKVIHTNRGFKYKLYLFIWCTSLFFRRIILKFIRLFARLKKRKPI